MKDIFNRPVINSFQGEHAFLSNFHLRDFWWNGYTWASSEHAYQAMKCVHHEEFVLFLDRKLTAGQAKRLGRRVQVQPDWDSIKLRMMEYILTAKFSMPDLAAKLLATDDAILIEGNNWGDTFWGECDGEGSNHLGHTLMYVRDSKRVVNAMMEEENGS